MKTLGYHYNSTKIKTINTLSNEKDNISTLYKTKEIKTINKIA